MTDGPKILIVGPAWIGDMVMAQTLFKLIRSYQKNAIIDVLAPAWTIPLLERMIEVRSIILLPFQHGQLQLKKRYDFAKQLRKKYDQAIVLPNSLKSALIPWWAHIPRRTGWIGEWRWPLINDVRTHKKNFPLMIQQFMTLGLLKGFALPSQLQDFYPSLTIDADKQADTVKKLNLRTDRPVLALCPGAEFGPAKRWPAKYFAVVAKTFLEKNWQVWIFGSKGDIETAEIIMENTQDRCINLTGKTALTEAIDLLSLTQAVISNDSGLMHIAAALNRPLVVLYGSSSPAFTPPLSPRAVLLSNEIPCSPCFKRVCPLKHFDCMNKLLPETIIAKLHELL